MDPLTPTERQMLNNGSPGHAAVSLGDRLALAASLQAPGRVATAHLRLTALPLAGDTVSVVAGSASDGQGYVPNDGATWEFTTTGAVQPGNLPVVLGASVAACASALGTAIAGRLARLVRASAHPQDTSVVDVAHTLPGGTLTVSTSAPARLVGQNNNEQLGPQDFQLYVIRRVLTPEDVLRGRLRVDTGLGSILNAFARLYSSASDQLADPYNGPVTVTGGTLELGQGSGSGTWASGNVVELTIFALR